MALIEDVTKPIECRNLVGDKFVGVERTQAVTSPYTGKIVGQVALSGAREVAAVVEAAKAAAPMWRDTPIKERAQVLLNVRNVFLKHLDALGNLAAVESGKTVAEGKAGVLKGLEVLEYAISLQNMDAGQALEVSRGVMCESRREPLGVVAGITPFNFPAMVPMWMYPIAIALGNVFVLKPSEKVPLTATKMGELMLQAGLPPGVFSIAHGGRDAVEALIDHADVQAVAFVGSSPVAKAVYQRATALGKRALALGGAKNHLIVVPDADPSVTIPGVVASFTGCAGQRCMAASVLVAVGNVDKLIDGIVAAAAKVKLGSEMGAIIDRAALERLHRDIDSAVAAGATLRTDGRKPKAPDGYEGGNWLGPTVLDNVRPEMAAAQVELFGPVLAIVRVKSLDEALALEQRSPYGNATSVFTTSGAVARYVADKATTGMIGVNIGVPVPREPFSFGGTKASRFGASDITGDGGVAFWTQTKKVTTKWALQPDMNWMS